MSSKKLKIVSGYYVVYLASQLLVTAPLKAYNLWEQCREGAGIHIRTVNLGFNKRYQFQLSQEEVITYLTKAMEAYQKGLEAIGLPANHELLAKTSTENIIARIKIAIPNHSDNISDCMTARHKIALAYYALGWIEADLAKNKKEYPTLITYFTKALEVDMDGQAEWLRHFAHEALKKNHKAPHEWLIENYFSLWQNNLPKPSIAGVLSLLAALDTQPISSLMVKNSSEPIAIKFWIARAKEVVATTQGKVITDEKALATINWLVYFPVLTKERVKDISEDLLNKYCDLLLQLMQQVDSQQENLGFSNRKKELKELLSHHQVAKNTQNILEASKKKQNSEKSIKSVSNRPNNTISSLPISDQLPKQQLPNDITYPILNSPQLPKKEKKSNIQDSSLDSTPLPNHHDKLSTPVSNQIENQKNSLELYIYGLIIVGGIIAIGYLIYRYATRKKIATSKQA